MAAISPERFLALRRLCSFTQEEMGSLLGVSAKYVGMIERGDKQVEETGSLGLLFQVKESAADGGHAGVRPARSAESYSQGSSSSRMVPVVSWAHAGSADSFEELPASWQDKVPTECRDEKAFAVRLIGDSMGPLYVEGDMLILQPSQEIYSGCLAVVRLANDGILFRRVERRADRLVLVPLNPQYKIEEFTAEEISWAYPLWGMWRQVCK
jgi:SOS-response transcriptional repressor LexA